MKNYIIVIILASIIVYGCNEQSYTPKPRGYYRITFPKKDYQTQSVKGEYKLTYPTYAKLVKPKKDNDWVNVDFQRLNAQINITYKDFKGDFNRLSEESRKWVYNHTSKADAISEKPFVNRPKKVYGMLYKIEGNTASSMQFYMTDSIGKFIRGALYLKITPNKDSLAPVLKFLEHDVIHMMETFEWEK